MADIALDYTQIQSVSSILNNAVSNIVPELSTLQTQVDALLGPDGGLYMQKSSAAFHTAYHTFNASLTSAVNSINEFASNFTSIATQMQSMDTAMANSINNPKSG